MRVALGKFARTGLEARLGSDLAAAVRLAVAYYVRRLESDWMPPSYPRFRRHSLPVVPDIAVELSLDPATQGILRREVKRQGAPLEQVAAHAVLVYLSHLEETASTKFI